MHVVNRTQIMSPSVVCLVLPRVIVLAYPGCLEGMMENVDAFVVEEMDRRRILAVNSGEVRRSTYVRLVYASRH